MLHRWFSADRCVGSKSVRSRRLYERRLAICHAAGRADGVRQIAGVMGKFPSRLVGDRADSRFERGYRRPAGRRQQSGSNPIRVVLRWQRGRPCLQVIDRGKGFVPGLEPDPGGGFGLTSMRERAAAVGAQLQVKSAVGSGTTVEVAF